MREESHENISPLTSEDGSTFDGHWRRTVTSGTHVGREADDAANVNVVCAATTVTETPGMLQLASFTRFIGGLIRSSQSGGLPAAGTPPPIESYCSARFISYTSSDVRFEPGSAAGKFKMIITRDQLSLSRKIIVPATQYAQAAA